MNNKYQASPAQALRNEYLIQLKQRKNTKSIRLRDRGKKERVNASWLKPFLRVFQHYRFVTLMQLL